jgi:hypothetical protein
VDATTLWPIVFVFKLTFVGLLALMIALSLWMLEHALRQGVVPGPKPSVIRTRAQTPLRYWAHIVGQLLFIAAIAVMIDAVIRLGEPREHPAANVREEQPVAPARPNDESYDRADVDAGSGAVWERGRAARA